MEKKTLTNQINLQITNNSAAPIKHFEIFGTHNNLQKENKVGYWDENGNFTINGATISSLTDGTSYWEIPNFLQQNPFSRGAIFLEHIAGNKQQIEDVYSVISKNSDGKINTKKLKPFKDPYQFDKGITFNSLSFNIDALTKFSWEIIYPRTVFQITIFSAQIIDPSAALCGQSVENNFNRPRVLTNFLRVR